MKAFLAAGLCALVLAGCSTYNGSRDTEERASNHMRIADSLEQAAALSQAAFEYRLVVQHYPTSTSYPVALKKGGLLYLNPDNPAQNDSIALGLLSEYLALPLPWSDREGVRTYVALLERIQRLRTQLARQEAAADSLSQAMKRQGSLTASQAQRIQELEAQAKSATGELKRLKDVDVRISKSRIKRQ